MVNRKIDFPYTQNIGYLLKLAKESGLEFPDSVNQSVVLSTYSTVLRCPSEMEPATLMQYHEALDLAEAQCLQTTLGRLRRASGHFQGRCLAIDLHIRYGQMTCALIAQTVIHQLRLRLGSPCASWDAGHPDNHLFTGLEGDVRICDDIILVTYYNAPQVDLLRSQFEHLLSLAT